MHCVLILGAGKIGALISGLLGSSGNYQVQLADVEGTVAEAVVRAHGAPGMSAYALNAKQRSALEQHLASHPVDAVISSLPFYCNVTVAEAARSAGVLY
ncbi:MAG: saccharopine dehydrogenase NADP-binding domain-containing protein, partial [Steroidobacteraceae bacterium]